MLLLEAVNTCLHALGEARVTRTDVRHPSVDLILGVIELKKKQLLETGYWFNTAYATMYPNHENKMEFPVDALSITSVRSRKIYEMRDSMLFNVTDNTEYFDGPVEIKFTYNIDFDNLPTCAANVVMYRAMREVYVGDLGNDETVSNMLQNEAAATHTMETLNLRNRKYNTRQRYPWRTYRNALSG